MSVRVGVNNTAKDIKGGYIGVNGVAKKILKIYAGVNGVAKLVYPDSPDYTGFNVALSGRKVLLITYSGVNFTITAISVGTASFELLGGGVWRMQNVENGISVIQINPNNGIPPFQVSIEYQVSGGLLNWEII
jgi:hypothetical protein